MCVYFLDFVLTIVYTLVWNARNNYNLKFFSHFFHVSGLLPHHPSQTSVLTGMQVTELHLHSILYTHIYDYAHFSKISTRTLSMQKQRWVKFTCSHLTSIFTYNTSETCVRTYLFPHPYIHTYIKNVKKLILFSFMIFQRQQWRTFCSCNRSNEVTLIIILNSVPDNLICLTDTDPRIQNPDQIVRICIFLADPDPNRHQRIRNSDVQIWIYEDN